MKLGAAPAVQGRDRAGDNRYQGAARGERVASGPSGRREETFAGGSAMASAFAKLKR
jgi:uncharacterized protein